MAENKHVLAVFGGPRMFSIEESRLDEPIELGAASIMFYLVGKKPEEEEPEWPKTRRQLFARINARWESACWFDCLKNWQQVDPNDDGDRVYGTVYKTDFEEPRKRPKRPLYGPGEK